MVDQRKKMHRELMAKVLDEFKGALHIRIPYLAQIERMGISREPVTAFAPQSVASKSYQTLWAKLSSTLLADNIR